MLPECTPYSCRISSPPKTGSPCPLAVDDNVKSTVVNEHCDLCARTGGQLQHESCVVEEALRTPLSRSLDLVNVPGHIPLGIVIPCCTSCRHRAVGQSSAASRVSCHNCIRTEPA